MFQASVGSRALMHASMSVLYVTKSGATPSSRMRSNSARARLSTSRARSESVDPRTTPLRSELYVTTLGLIFTRRISANAVSAGSICAAFARPSMSVEYVYTFGSTPSRDMRRRISSASINRPARANPCTSAVYASTPGRRSRRGENLIPCSSASTAKSNLSQLT